MKISAIVLVPLALLLSVGCSNVGHIVTHNQFQEITLQGEPFQHTVFINLAGQRADKNTSWHVYIEGDGRAVNRSGKPSLDPTPRQSLVLEMMAADPSPALYLGRPCHFQTEDTHCHPQQWTLARYSEETVNSMQLALAQWLEPTTDVTLIGHSGGGTLAVLLAPRLPNRTHIVTLAGNLQVQKWTNFHGFTPLKNSLDPMTQPPLSNCIAQSHLAGKQDQQILWQWIEEFSNSQPNSVFQVLESTDHRQNWPHWWLLVEFRSIINQQDCGKVTPTKHP